MSDGMMPGARLLGGARPTMPEIITYPMAEIGVHSDGLGIADATHFLQIILPVNGKEIRVPLNGPSLRRISHMFADAVAAGEAKDDKSEG